MDANRSQQIHNIRLLSQQMLQLARDGEWEILADIEPKRRDLILHFFDRPADEDETAEIVATIQDVLDIDREIIERGQMGRDAVRQELGKINQGQRAVQAYHEVS